jgi:hypothetical protein
MRVLANSRETLRTADRLRAAVVDASQAEIELLFEHAERLGRSANVWPASSG